MARHRTELQRGGDGAAGGVLPRHAPPPLTNRRPGVDGLHHVHAMPVTRRDTLLAPQQSRLGRVWVREMQSHLNPLIDPHESAPFWSAFIR